MHSLLSLFLSELIVFVFLFTNHIDKGRIVSVAPARRHHGLQKGTDLAVLFNGVRVVLLLVVEVALFLE